MTLLKTHIEFRSDNFPQTAEEKEEFKEILAILRRQKPDRIRVL